MRACLLLAYDGSNYSGFARQPGAPTIEGQLLEALQLTGLVSDFKSARCQVAGRTDRGVSAVGQVVAVSITHEPDVDELNAVLPADIAVLGWSLVPSRFNPRKEALSKHYRYVCAPPSDLDFQLVKKAVKMFEGPHDFRCFCKREKGKSTFATISFASCHMNEGLVFDFVAPFFLWQQVRRMVEALLELGRGVVGEEWLRLALDGNAPRSFRPAPADGLFLARVTFRKLMFDLNKHGYAKFVTHLKKRNDLRSREMLKFLIGEKSSFIRY